MSFQYVSYTLPEFVFLDGNSHEGNSLEHRSVLQHIRSYTILEVVSLDEILTLKETEKRFDLDYKNGLGAKEKYAFILHFTLAEEQDLMAIFVQCRKWYCDYLDWEDNNIITDVEAENN